MIRCSIVASPNSTVLIGKRDPPLYSSLYAFSVVRCKDFAISCIDLTNSPFLTYQEDGAEYRAQCATLDKLPCYLKLKTLGQT